MNLVLRCVFACIACLGFVIVSHSTGAPTAAASPVPAAGVQAAAPATLTARSDRNQ